MVAQCPKHFLRCEFGLHAAAVRNAAFRGFMASEAVESSVLGGS